MKLIFLGTIAFSLCACSIYESDGRKYLEQTGLTFYNNTKVESAYVRCSTQAPSPEWTTFATTERGRFLGRTSMTTDLMVVPGSLTPMSCLFHFTTEKELAENSPDAMEFCLHQSPGGCQP